MKWIENENENEKKQKKKEKKYVDHDVDKVDDDGRGGQPICMNVYFSVQKWLKCMTEQQQ